MKEHIDYCFTCMAKTIAVEKQVAIILKDVYDFKVKEIAVIMNLGYDNIKKMLLTGRKSLDTIFNQKCALVNKNGVCHQCTELNGAFNPKQNQKEQLLKIKMVKESEKGKKENLYKLRTELIKNIDPFTSKGANLHDFFIDVARYNAGEITESPYF
jgi:RNA polymerase sigma-70 factor (ECF subfamily)